MAPRTHTPAGPGEPPRWVGAGAGAGAGRPRQPGSGTAPRPAPGTASRSLCPRSVLRSPLCLCPSHRGGGGEKGGSFFSFFFFFPPPSSSLSLSAGSCQDAKLEIAAPDAFCAARRGSSFAGCCQEAGPGPGPRRGPTSAGAPRSRPPRAERELAGSAGPCGRGRNFRRVPSGGAGAVRAERIGSRCIARPSPSPPAPPSAEGGTAVRRGTPGAQTEEPRRRLPPGRAVAGRSGGGRTRAALGNRGNRGGSGRTDSADCPPIGGCDLLQSSASVSHREQLRLPPLVALPAPRRGKLVTSVLVPGPPGPAAGSGKCLARVGRARGSCHLPAVERQRLPGRGSRRVRASNPSRRDQPAAPGTTAGGAGAARTTLPGGPRCRRARPRPSRHPIGRLPTAGRPSPPPVGWRSRRSAGGRTRRGSGGAPAARGSSALTGRRAEALLDGTGGSCPPQVRSGAGRGGAAAHGPAAPVLGAPSAGEAAPPSAERSGALRTR